jgi:predicted nucleic acid binding AN1-type Zn finger protein
MVSTEILSLFQAILLVIILIATVIIALMVYDIHRISRVSKVKGNEKKSGEELPTVEEVKCSKCGNSTKLVYEGKIVNGYFCSKCKTTEIMSRKSVEELIKESTK